jgi:hypothetical protein
MAPNPGELDLGRGGNTISIDSATITLDTKTAESLGTGIAGAGGGSILANAISLGIANSLGQTKVTEGLGGIKNPGEFLLKPLGRELGAGIQKILDSIDANIRSGPLGQGSQFFTEGVQGADAGFKEATGVSVFGDLGQSTADIAKAVKELQGLDQPFSRLRANLSAGEYQSQIQNLAQTFLFLTGPLGAADKDVKDFIKSIGTQSNSIDEINKKLRDEYATSIAAFAQNTNQSFGQASESYTKFFSQFRFLGRDAGQEAARLATLSERLGVSLGGVFTKNLVSFDEAAQLGASLGTVLRGINFDLNDFVNSKPSERVEMVLGEVADAIDEGRFNIEEDGVKFGQQISILQQSLGGEFTEEQITDLLTRARTGGGTAIRAAIAQSQAAAGAQVSPEQLGQLAMGQRTVAEAQQAPIQGALVGADVGGVRTGGMQALDEFNKNITENNFQQQVLPLVEALKEFTITTQAFAKEGEGPLAGLVRNALLGDVNPTEVLSKFDARVTEASGELGSTLDALKGRAKDSADAVAGIATSFGDAGEKMSQAVKDFDQKGVTGFTDQIVKALVTAFNSPQVTEALAESMKKAGVTAVQKIKVGQ